MTINNAIMARACLRKETMENFAGVPFWLLVSVVDTASVGLNRVWAISSSCAVGV